MSHRFPSINLLMGAAFYEHEHHDNHVMNICNSVKEWIRNTLNVFFTLSNKANDEKEKETCAEKKTWYFLIMYL